MQQFKNGWIAFHLVLLIFFVLASLLKDNHKYLISRFLGDTSRNEKKKRSVYYALKEDKTEMN